MLAVVVLAAFGIVVGAGTLFACPFMQAQSCCSKANPGGHCPSDKSETCVLAVSDNKIAIAKEKVVTAAPLTAAAAAAPDTPRPADVAEPHLSARSGRETYLVNRVLRV